MEFFPRILRKKYILTVIVFIVWITFFDENNLIDRVQNLSELHQLSKNVDYYREKITQDSLKLEELIGSDANIEKFAREEYMMHKKNEDVFLVVGV